MAQVKRKAASEPQVAANGPRPGSERSADDRPGTATVWARVAVVQIKLKHRLELPVWKPGAARDPELRKILLRLLACLNEACRLRESGFDDELERRLESLLTGPVATLGLQAAIEVLDGFDQLLIAAADDKFLRNLFELELHRAEKNAAEGVDPFAGPYITWTAYFGDRPPAGDDASAALRIPPLHTAFPPADRGSAGAALAALLMTRGLVLEQPRARPARTWRSLLDDGSADSEVYEDLRRRLSALRWARSSEFRLHRARQAMRARALRFLAPVLIVLTGGLALAIGAAAEGPIAASILLAALAGALGGTMAGTLKLRDNVSRIGDLRSLRPALYVQPLLGAAAGLILLLAVVGGFLTESPEQGWAKYGLLAFAAGFSEPFFLGIVNRVASTGNTPSSPPSP